MNLQVKSREIIRLLPEYHVPLDGYERIHREITKIVYE